MDDEMPCPLATAAKRTKESGNSGISKSIPRRLPTCEGFSCETTDVPDKETATFVFVGTATILFFLGTAFGVSLTVAEGACRKSLAGRQSTLRQELVPDGAGVLEGVGSSNVA